METSQLTKATRVSQARSLVLIAVVVVIYGLENFLPVLFRSSSLFIYIGRPFLWLLAALTVLFLPRTRPRGKLRYRGLLIWLTVILAGAYVLAMMLGGLLQGFGKSPYNHLLFGILTNMIFVFTALTGRELIRDYLVNNRTVKDYFFTLWIIAAFMTLAGLPVDGAAGLRTKLDITKYLGEVFLPELSNNILASYLVYMGGPVLSIIYLGIQQSFYWFFPILPNLNWITRALIGTLCPFFSLMLLQYTYHSEAKTLKNSQKEESSPFGWILTCIISIAIVWFAAGVFPVRPLVVATGSMEPAVYPGDIVLVKNIKTKDLEVGDIVQYERDHIYIFHRIIDIVGDKQEISYRTKGDNNSGPDPVLVKPEDIRGRVFSTIPKLGLPTLLLKSGGSVDKKAVEF